MNHLALNHENTWIIDYINAPGVILDASPRNIHVFIIKEMGEGNIIAAKGYLNYNTDSLLDSLSQTIVSAEYIPDSIRFESPMIKSRAFKSFCESLDIDISHPISHPACINEHYLRKFRSQVYHETISRDFSCISELNTILPVLADELCCYGYYSSSKEGRHVC